MKLALITISFFACLSAQAQQFNVVQVKGNRAIVEVQTGEKLKVGESYSVGKTNGEEESSNNAKGARNYLLGLDLSLSSTKSDSAGAVTVLEMGGVVKFGWNKKKYEFGPVGIFEYTKLGSLEPSTTFGIGGFGTYNFQNNEPGTELIFSGDAQFVYTTQKQGSSSTNGYDIQLGPFVKWFGLSGDHCITGGLVFSFNKQSPTGGDVTTSGIKAIAGISTYF